MADRPEQSLLTSVIGEFCPVCTVPKSSLGDQENEWPTRVPKNKMKTKNNDIDETEEENSTSNDSVKQEHPQTTFMECLWPELNPYRVVAPDTLHQLEPGLFKHYLIP
jgi:hypothetical protein